MQNKRSYFFYSENKPLTMSRMLILQKSLTERQIKKKIFKLMRPLIQAPDIDHQKYSSMEKSEDNILELEYRTLFEDRNPANYDEDGEHKYYKLCFFNNAEIHQGMLFSYRNRCEFCEREHKDHCEFTFP